MFTLIAAVGMNKEIGKDNNLIWDIPTDLKFFKEITLGKTVVMGRKTYAYLPKKLLNRRIIVVSTHRIEFSKMVNEVDVTFVDSVEDVLRMFENTEEEIFIAGGESIYDQFIKYADKMYLTEIQANYKDADSYFPDFDTDEWDRKEMYSEWENGLRYTFVEYRRKK